MYMPPEAQFQSTTSSLEAYSPHGRTGAQLVDAATRVDIALKYGKYGKTEPLGDPSRDGFFASTAQLAFGHAASKDGGVVEDGCSNPACHRVQDILWTGKNMLDAKVPKNAPGKRLIEERNARLAREQVVDPFKTMEKEELERVAKIPRPKRLEARQPAQRPNCKSQGGQE
jgi:hypothetical protein